MNADWESIKSAVRARREALTLSQSEAAARAGITQDRWRVLENSPEPVNVRGTTARGIATALKWVPDAWSQLQAGVDPAELAIPEEQPQFYERLARLEARLQVLREDHQADRDRLAGIESQLRDLLSTVRGE